MKKVASSKQTVFDDPLFNPGDSFNVRDSDEYIAPVASRKPAPDLVNTLTLSGDDTFLTTSKPMKTNKKSKPTPTPVSESAPAVKQKEIVNDKEPPAPKVNKPKATEKTDPLKVSAGSVCEHDGEDLFLPSSGGVKKKTEPSFEEELFGKSSSSSSQSQEVKMDESNLRLGTHDSDSDNEIEDLGVGAIMEREELDFDMFGKSNVRQFEPMQREDDEASSNSGQQKTNSTATSTVRKDDLILESNDILSDFESLLSDEGSTKKPTVVSASPSSVSNSKTATSNVVVDNSYDIDAYISQQEESSGGGLFD